MLFTFNQVMILMIFAVVVILVGIIAGGWLVFKSRNAVPGEGLFGGVPKGEIFHLPDDTSGELEDQAEKSILERGKEFLKVFGGGQQ